MKQSKRIVIIIACIAAIVLTGCIYYAGYHYYTSHFYPGSMINDTDISGTDADTAKETALNQVARYELTIYGKETEDQLSASDIGFTYIFTTGDEDYISKALTEQNPAVWPIALIIREKGIQITLQYAYDTEMMAESVHSLSCISPENPQEPENAYYTYKEGQYVIIQETEGNIADENEVLAAVNTAVLTGETEVSVTDCYSTAEIKSDDEILNQIVDAANLILSSSITITTAYHTATLDADTIQTFLVINDTEGTVEIDEDLVYAWVKENVSSPNYTVGSTRTIQTPSSDEITVSGGTYGIWVDMSAESAQFIEELNSGTTVEREPNYTSSEKSTENGGVGYTYIDVNISEQMVYLVEDNVVTYSTQCVTGSVSSGHDTPTGTYYVSWKTTNWLMKTYNSFVYYWMPIDDSTGVGMHDATWRSSFGGSIYKTNGSHGCINLPYEAAQYLYNNTEVEIPVIVH